MKIYTVSTDYVNYLRDNADRKVLINEDDGRTRKYVGIVIEINGFNYFVPLSSPKTNDYVFINGEKTVRKSVVPIHRIITVNGNKQEFFGKLKFSSMIPVPDSEVTLLDINSIEDDKYKSILENQIRYIRKNSTVLQKNHANVIYRQRIKGLTNQYLSNTVDFSLCEQKCIEYQAAKQKIVDASKEVTASDERKA